MTSLDLILFVAEVLALASCMSFSVFLALIALTIAVISLLGMMED